MGIAIYGTLILEDISQALLKRMDVLKFSQFLSSDTGFDTAETIFRVILKSYRNLRGKDFVKKSNSNEGAKLTQTTHPALAVAWQIAKNEMWR